MVVVHFENVNLALFASSLRHVGECKLVGQGVDYASLRRRKGRGEGHTIPLGRLLKQQQLRVELQDLGIVEVDI